MSTFKDTKSREWTIRLDFAALHAIRDSAQVDLGDVERLAETWANLLYDDGLSLLLVWLTISKAAESQGVSRDDFTASMDGNTLESALSALGDAIQSFTQPRKRGMAERAIRGVNEGMAKAIAEAETKIQTLLEAKTSEALEVLGKSPPSVPESSDSSTTDGR